MQPESQTDHIALLALMICGTLIERMNDLGQLDEATASRLHHLVKAVSIHANRHDVTDLDILFRNIDRALGNKVPQRQPG